ncbi:hypothetical protein SPD48_00230 [Pseudogracilibacillus sp. SE30717A]|uniref:hypothetical protein n=1 Tax=Pseudogracilibacillus sp. SE30717A TaxID=3098293 RepID=UPI00300E117B
MPKQTVEQQYTQQQAMKSELKPKDKANMALKTKQQQHIAKILNAINQSLQEAQQAVRQVKGTNPIQPQLRLADDRLSNATQLLQQLQISAPEMVFGFSKGEQQQLKQLDYQIEKAASTLQLIQQSISSK